MYFSINLALESIVNTSFLLSLIISTSALVEVCGAFGIRNSLVHDDISLSQEENRHHEAIIAHDNHILLFSVVYSNSARLPNRNRHLSIDVRECGDHHAY
jgi:hypothetical protein